MANKKKLEILIPICILFFFAISIISIYSATSILSSNYENLYIKQLLWYGCGLIIFLFVLFCGDNKILRYVNLIYCISIFLLILVLIIGNEVNNTRAWIDLNIISFQPSEFAKLGLILLLSKILYNYHFEENKNWKHEIKLIIKIMFYTTIPSLLVFVEPDTGAVIAYLFIALGMIFISEIRIRWIIFLIIAFCIFLGGFLYFYIKFPNNFISFFGDDMYYRIFRIVDWQNTSGIQLKNSLITIGTSGLLGNGLNNPPLYFPEPYTDFIFPIYASNFGLIGMFFLITTLVVFNIKIIGFSMKSSNTLNKYIIFGILLYFLYPQIQNMAMTIGVLPITGIPLPFISYGGSSLIVSFIMIALAIKLKKS